MPKYNDFQLDVQNTTMEKGDEKLPQVYTIYTDCSCDGRLTGCYAIVRD